MIDFRVNYRFEGKAVWPEAKMFSECTEAEKLQANLRTIFEDEIVLDCDTPESVETVPKRLQKEGFAFMLVKSPNGVHVHMTFTELANFTLEKRKLIRDAFIREYGADPAKSSELTFISTPGKVHFKTKDFISTVEHFESSKPNKLPEYAIKAAGEVLKIKVEPSTEIQAIPAWLAELIQNGMPENDRHVNEYIIIKELYNRGYNAKFIMQAALRYNSACRPPKPNSIIEKHVTYLLRNISYLTRELKLEEIRTVMDEPLMELTDADTFIKQNENTCVEWIVEKLIPAGAIILAAGKRASFKSWVANKLAVCVSKGEPFFGCKTMKSPVILIDAENASFVLAQRLKSIGGGRDLMVQCGETFRFELQDGQLLAKAKTLGVKLIIVDSMRRTHNADENDAAEVNELFRDHLRQFKEAGITLLFLYHMRKGLGSGQTSDDPMDEIRGSSEFANLADMIYTVSRCRSPSNHIVIRQAKNRLAPEVEPAQIEINTNNGTAEFKLIGTGTQSVRTADEICADSLAELLKEREGKVIPTSNLKELAETIEQSHHVVYGAISLLLTRGVLSKEKRGRYYIVPQKEKLDNQENLNQ